MNLQDSRLDLIFVEVYLVSNRFRFGGSDEFDQLANCRFEIIELTFTDLRAVYDTNGVDMLPCYYC